MKKTTILALMLSLGGYAQQSFCSISGNIDARNALIGSKPTGNNPALDFTLKVHAVSKGFEMSGGYERFQQIGFSREMANFGYNSERFIPIGNKDFDFTAIPYIGGSLIHRFGKDDRTVGDKFIYGNSSHLALQIGMSFRYAISDKWLLDLTYEIMTRPDLNYLYPTDNNPGVVGSGTVGIHYVLSKN